MFVRFISCMLVVSFCVVSLVVFMRLLIVVVVFWLMWFRGCVRMFVMLLLLFVLL